MNDAAATLCIDEEFFQKTLDSLRSHVAVLNDEGVIVSLNSPGDQFATRYGLAEHFSGPGVNYVQACDQATGSGSEEAAIIAKGIRDVLAFRRESFYLEYACHSPFEQRWFSMRVTRFEAGDSLFAVLTHENITQRCIAEHQVREVNRQLESQLTIDGLTGVANRRCFDRTLEKEWRRHQRNRRPLTVALLNVDCFKQYNDQRGHMAGDDCLKQVAQAIAANMRRPGDFVARYGGEQFAVILPDTDALGAKTVCRNTLRSIRKLAIPNPTSTVRRGIVTMSIGCTTAIPHDQETTVELLSRADEALYHAKVNGRDQACCFDQPAQLPELCPCI